ncbi:MAG: hypothetical protein HC901_02705 [Bdellovibrionaceae bacterium]|nr:hypothetical protein [Pseudobdellovibrionaceae bacterium]
MCFEALGIDGHGAEFLEGHALGDLAAGLLLHLAADDVFEHGVLLAQGVVAHGLVQLQLQGLEFGAVFLIGLAQGAVFLAGQFQLALQFVDLLLEFEDGLFPAAAELDIGDGLFGGGELLLELLVLLHEGGDLLFAGAFAGGLELLLEFVGAGAQLGGFGGGAVQAVFWSEASWLPDRGCVPSGRWGRRATRVPAWRRRRGGV